MPAKTARPSAWQRACLLALACTALLCASATGADARKLGEVDIVRQSGAPAGEIPANTHYFTTIQAAVNASKKGAWVLIEPGVYYEEVKVAKAQSMAARVASTA